ncbi:MAG TPA: M23 family metallopeptidase, partial [Marmoricola sp.]|nr:M23 family metallopeptidase [Marmoricola sp.]
MNRIVPVLLSRRTPTVPAVVLLTVLVTVVGVVGTAPAAAAVRPDPPGTALPTLVDAPAPAGGAVWPLRPRPEVVSGFDPPSTRWGAGHRGVDLAGSVAAPVRTALPGVVTFAGRIAGRGVVVVSHGDTRTTYEPVRDAVDVGDRV